MKELMSIKMIENEAGEIELMVDPDDVTGAHFDLLVQAISRVRAQFLPPVPEQPPQAMDQIPVVAGSAAFLGEVFPHGNVIGLRHPALGWVAFQVSQEFLQKLCNAQLSSRHPASDPVH